MKLNVNFGIHFALNICSYISLIFHILYFDATVNNQNAETEHKNCNCSTPVSFLFILSTNLIVLDQVLFRFMDWYLRVAYLYPKILRKRQMLENPSSFLQGLYLIAR